MIAHGCTRQVIYGVEVDAIVVLEVFAKKTNKTPGEVLSNRKRRLKAFRAIGDRTMKAARRKKLEAAGWKVGNTAEFLGLSPEEAKIVEMKLALGNSLRRYRIRRGWTQQDLAKRLGSSQSRVAKLERGALGVTLDLLFRALFVAGASTDEVARELRSRRRSAV